MHTIKNIISTVVFVLLIVACNKQLKPVGEQSIDNVDITAMEQTVVRTSTTASTKENYENYCGSCHGMQMKAFVDRKWKHGSTKADLIRSISVGIIDDGMPSYDTTFTVSEIEDLAEYILTGISDRASFDIGSKLTPKFYSTKSHQLMVDTVVNNIEIPWGIKVTKDGTIYFTEREGAFKIKSPDGNMVTVKNVPSVRNKGQGGMLDVLLDPDFDSNRVLYLSYSKNKMIDGRELATTAIIKARLDGDALVNVEEIFEALPYLPTNHHYGCRMFFDKDGYMFITVGDRGRRMQNPQSLSMAPGKVHRINADGTIPHDNPFVGVNRAMPSIWSYGHRNPQGLTIDHNTGEIWENEHGPRGGDELNLVERGKNYGWPVISYGINYNGTTFTDLLEKEGLEQPENYWVPSIAPSGMATVTGDNYPGWEGDILTGSLRFNYVSRIEVNGGQVVEEEKILQDIGRVRSIDMGADGYLYVGVENPGRILKVTVRK